MTSTETIRSGEIFTFVPFNRTNRISVIVDTVTTTGSMVFVHGIRCNSEGCIDSQAQRHAWPIGPR
jgi:hypothetical protein